jgi:hypothetical protein
MMLWSTVTPSGQRVMQFQHLLVFTERNKLVRVVNDGVLHPVGIGRIGAAIRFEIIDADLVAGDLIAFDD